MHSRLSCWASSTTTRRSRPSRPRWSASCSSSSADSANRSRRLAGASPVSSPSSLRQPTQAIKTRTKHDAPVTMRLRLPAIAMRCRIEPYWNKAAPLRGAAGAPTAGLRPWGPARHGRAAAGQARRSIAFAQQAGQCAQADFLDPVLSSSQPPRQWRPCGRRTRSATPTIDPAATHLGFGACGKDERVQQLPQGHEERHRLVRAPASDETGGALSQPPPAPVRSWTLGH
jgi:hypothetical protein